MQHSKLIETSCTSDTCSEPAESFCYLVVTDGAHRSGASVLTLGRAGSANCGRRGRGGGAERVGGGLARSFVHTERGLYETGGDQVRRAVERQKDHGC